MLKNISWWSILTWWLCANATAQFLPMSSSRLLPSDLTSLQFRQELNTYVWQYEIGRDLRITDRLSVALYEQFRSSMLRLHSEDDKWKDDQNLSIILNYRLFKSLALHAKLNSATFNDKQSGFNNDVNTHLGVLGFDFTPNSYFYSKAAIGPKWDVRFGYDDRGVNYRVEMLGNELLWQGYNNRFHLTLEQDNFAKRKNKDFNVNYYMTRTFAPGVADSLSVFTANRRRDNYTSELSDIESLRENAKGFDNTLNYTINRWARMRLKNSLMFRNVEVASISDAKTKKRRKRNDQISDHAMILEMAGKRVKGHMMLAYFAQEQKYDIDLGDANLPFSRRTAFVTPNNQSNRLYFNTDIRMRFNPADSLYGYLSVSRFQYDTPDTNNFDDRDELRITSRVIWSHYFSRFLKFELESSVNLYHMVYIFGERSADNNWNRIWRLRPSLDYMPSDKIRLYQSFEVLANFVSYDFENDKSFTKSFVFRKFALDDSLRIKISKKKSFHMDYRLQTEENGQLFWDRWTERVLSTKVSHWLQGQFIFGITNKFQLAPGYTLYFRDEWRHETDNFGVEKKEKYSSFSSHGPMMRIFYAPSKKLRIVFDSVRRSVRPQAQSRYFINTIDLKLDWFF